MPGHWEGDLLFGDAYSQIATLVERRTCYVMLVKVVDKDSHTVVAALARQCADIAERAVSLVNLGSWIGNGGA